MAVSQRDDPVHPLGESVIVGRDQCREAGLAGERLDGPWWTQITNFCDNEPSRIGS